MTREWVPDQIVAKIWQDRVDVPSASGERYSILVTGYYWPAQQYFSRHTNEQLVVGAEYVHQDSNEVHSYYVYVDTLPATLDVLSFTGRQAAEQLASRLTDEAQLTRSNDESDR